MKTILICPSQSSGIPALADSKPLIILPVLGEPFICYWLEHLSTRGVKEARLISTEDLETIEEVTGDGSRWGLKVMLLHELRELGADEARKRYRGADETDWPLPPADVIELGTLPGMDGRFLFSNYSEWFQAICEWMQPVCRRRRIGVKEIAPGVWAGRRSRIAPSARLHAPCWIGENVQVGRNAVVGPFAFLEDRVVLDESCEVTQSWVGPDTFLGALTRVEGSLAWGSTLINWESGSVAEVPDRFLMSSLAKKPVKKRKLPRKAAMAEESSMPRPLEAVISFAQKIQG